MPPQGVELKKLPGERAQLPGFFPRGDGLTAGRYFPRPPLLKRIECSPKRTYKEEPLTGRRCACGQHSGWSDPICGTASLGGLVNCSCRAGGLRFERGSVYLGIRKMHASCSAYWRLKHGAKHLKSRHTSACPRPSGTAKLRQVILQIPPQLLKEFSGLYALLPPKCHQKPSERGAFRK
jgi:hypothetical protein